MAKEPLKVIYEHSDDAELEGNVYDGMWDMLGDDILSSDFDPSLGQTWPGVNTAALPEIFRTKPQPGPDGLLPYPPLWDPRDGSEFEPAD